MAKLITGDRLSLLLPLRSMFSEKPSLLILLKAVRCTPQKTDVSCGRKDAVGFEPSNPSGDESVKMLLLLEQQTPTLGK